MTHVLQHVSFLSPVVLRLWHTTHSLCFSFERGIIIYNLLSLVEPRWLSPLWFFIEIIDQFPRRFLSKFLTNRRRLDISSRFALLNLEISEQYSSILHFLRYDLLLHLAIFFFYHYRFSTWNSSYSNSKFNNKFIRIFHSYIFYSQYQNNERSKTSSRWNTSTSTIIRWKFYQCASDALSLSLTGKIYSNEKSKVASSDPPLQ